MVEQTDGLAAASLSIAGLVSLRIVRAQRCSINALICSTTALPAKPFPGSDCSLRATAGNDLAISKIRLLACALVRPKLSANCSQCCAWTSLNLYLLPIRIAILGVSVGYTAVESVS